MHYRPANFGLNWTREELTLALELYRRLNFGQIGSRTAEVQQLAIELRRSVGSVARKLANFAAIDPVVRARGASGLANGGRLDQEVWDEFHQDQGGLEVRAKQIRAKAANPQTG